MRKQEHPSSHLETALCRKVAWEGRHLWNDDDHLRPVGRDQSLSLKENALGLRTLNLVPDRAALRIRWTMARPTASESHERMSAGAHAKGLCDEGTDSGSEPCGPPRSGSVDKRVGRACQPENGRRGVEADSRSKTVIVGASAEG